MPSVSSLVSLAFLHSRCRMMKWIEICREYSYDDIVRQTNDALNLLQYNLCWCQLHLYPLCWYQIYPFFSLFFFFPRHFLKAQVVSAILSLSQNFARFLLSLSSVFLQGQVHLLEAVTSWFYSLPHFWFTGKFELLSSACDVPQVCWALRWHGISYLILTAWCWAGSSSLLFPNSPFKLFWGPSLISNDEKWKVKNRA